jgi:electron transport complex protein RnfB
MMNTPTTPLFDPDSPYRQLARKLDSLPNRFPPAANESDLRLLAKLFTPDEATLAACLYADPQSPSQIATRLGRDAQEITAQLKDMSKKGLIAVGKTPEGRPGFGLMPFVVGIYEMQVASMDTELANLFEDYFQSAFGRLLEAKPQVHRVIPVGVSIKNTIEIQPFESVIDLIDNAKAWGVNDCICRKQKSLIGKPCQHPLDVCMILSQNPDAFAGSTLIHSLSHDEARQTLQRAAEAGLVHCVSNNQRDIWYICNCCTCSCGVLRGMAELGIANVVARSAFINRVDEALCIACEECLSFCQFNALSMNGVAHVEETRCVGCGVCVLSCTQGALRLERRPDEAAPPLTQAEWLAARRQSA